MIEIGDLVYPNYYGNKVLGIVCDIYVPRDRYKKIRAKILMKNGKAYNFAVEDLEIHTKKKSK